MKRLLEEIHEQRYTASTVTKVVGTNQNLLTQWVDRGFIKPVVRADGSGTRNEFSTEDLVRIASFMELSSAGIRKANAAGLAYAPESSASGVEIKKLISKLIDKHRESRFRKLKRSGFFDQPSHGDDPIIAHQHRAARVYAENLMKTQETEPALIVFIQYPDRIQGNIVTDQKQWMELYENWREFPLFHVVNMSLLTSRVLDRLSKLGV